MRLRNIRGLSFEGARIKAMLIALFMEGGGIASVGDLCIVSVFL
jgi:hypothetical protein